MAQCSFYNYTRKGPCTHRAVSIVVCHTSGHNLQDVLACSGHTLCEANFHGNKNGGFSTGSLTLRPLGKDN